MSKLSRIGGALASVALASVLVMGGGWVLPGFATVALAESTTACTGEDACSHAAAITNGETTTHYDTLTEALDDAGENQTVKVLMNCIVTDNDTYQVDKTISFDLNGFTVTWYTTAKNSFQVPSRGSLTVCDSSADSEGELEIVNTSTSAGVGINISTGGALTLQSGTISANIAKTSSYVIYASGNFDMSGGTIALDGNATNGLYLSANDDAPSSLANGTIKFRNKENGTLNGVNTYRTTTISNMTVDASAVDASSTARAIYNNCSSTSDRTVTINGGTYSVNSSSTKSYAVAGNNKKTNIINGTFNGVVQSASGRISGGSFSVEPASQYAVSGKVFQLDTSDNYYKLVDGSYVGRIGDKGYLTWDALFADCSTTDSATTVYLLSDAESITVPAGKNIKFQNMNKVTVGSLINNGTCEVATYALSGTQVTNNGTLKLSHEVGSLTNNEGGTVTAASSAVVTGNVTNHGTMAISAGKYLGSVTNDGMLTITGGSYRSVDGITVQDTENYGIYKIKDNAYGDLYAVYAKTDVQAQVGEYYYTKWNTAALQGTAQQPAKLLTDLTLSPSSTSPLNINSGSSYYLDLNGHTMNLQGKSAYNYGFKISKGSMNLYNSQPESGGIVFKSYNNNGTGTAFWMCGRMNDEGPDASVLRVAQGVTITSDAYSINMMTSGATDKYGMAVYFDGILDTMYGPYVNGQYNNMDGSVPVFNFLEHSEINAQSVGLYAAGFAKWNLAGDITSERAEPLSIKSGIFYITGGIYTANGAFHDPADANNNGSEATGAALSITSNDGYAQKIEVTVTGGTFISTNGYAVYEGIAKNGDTPAAAASYAALSIQGGSFKGGDGKDAVNITAAQNKQVISGGYFSTDPSAYLAENLAAVDSNDPDYNFTVGEAGSNPATVVSAPADVNVSETFTGDESLAESFAQALSDEQVGGSQQPDIGTALVSAAGSVANDNSVTTDTMLESGQSVLEALKNLDSTPETVAPDDVTIVIQPYLDIQITGASSDDSGNKTVTLDITPMYITVATTDSSNIVLDEEGEEANAVQVGDAKELVITKAVTVTLSLPENFAENGSLYIQHAASNGRTYFYTGTVNENVLTFTNPHGFSEFTISATNDAVAKVGEIGYASLQDAVDAAGDGDEVEILKGGTHTATMSGATRTVKLKNGTDTNITVTINGKAIAIAGSGETSFTYTAPSGGGSVATTYSVTVAEAENGEVTVDPTSAAEGDTVTVTATPAEGYEVASVAVTSGNRRVDVTDNGDGTFTFEMPAADVTVSVAFQAAAPAVDLPFTDVDEGDWYYGAVSFVYAKGLMTGYEGTTLFGPEDDLGREQAAMVLFRALAGASQAPAPECGLADVDQAGWYARAVNWAVASGLVTGYGDGSGLFGVGDALTRDQFAAIVARVAKADLSKADPSVLDGFSDGDEVAEWAVPAVSWAAQVGILEGSDDGNGGMELRPSVEITRGEMATMIQRAAEAGLLPTA